MLLGSLDVSPLEVAQLYNAFANGGFSTPLRAVRAVVDAEGKPIKSFALEVTPVADPAAVYQVNRMLVQVMEHGSGQAARAQIPPEIVVAGKTGTSSDYRDSWFAGFSGNTLAVVWIGYDDNSPTGLTGSSGSLRGVVAPDALDRNNVVERAVAGRPRRDVDRVHDRPGRRSRAAAARTWCMVAVPTRHATAGASRAANRASFGELGERAREWWRSIVR